MNEPDEFVFKSVTMDKSTLAVDLQYQFGDRIFIEKYSLGDIPNPVNLESEALTRALRLLHLTAGVSYYKTYAKVSKRMKVEYEIPADVANYLNHVYEEGLGEFYYESHLTPKLTSVFSGLYEASLPTEEIVASGLLIGLGGGKDSLVGASLLANLSEEKTHTYGINAAWMLERQSDILGSQHTQVLRSVDVAALQAAKDSLGDSLPAGRHIPISAILGCVGLIVAILNGKSEVVVSVERSANEATMVYMDKEINHQYAKSSDFEQSFDEIIKSWISTKLGYFSVLRPLRELEIMKLFFSLKLHKKFAGTYTSCNRSMDFTLQNNSSQLWCGTCDKCAFIFLLMCGANMPEYALEIFGKNLIDEPSLHDTYVGMLGLSESKPFECVGEIDEARESMTIAKRAFNSSLEFSYPEPAKSVVWDANNRIPKHLHEALRKQVKDLLGES